MGSKFLLAMRPLLAHYAANAILFYQAPGVHGVLDKIK